MRQARSRLTHYRERLEIINAPAEMRDVQASLELEFQYALEDIEDALGVNEKRRNELPLNDVNRSTTSTGAIPKKHEQSGLANGSTNTEGATGTSDHNQSLISFSEPNIGTLGLDHVRPAIGQNLSTNTSNTVPDRRISGQLMNRNERSWINTNQQTSRQS